VTALSRRAKALDRSATASAERPIVWIALALVSIASALFAWRYFPGAFPIVSLDLRMDRTAALSAARTLATERRVGPSGFREAASFSLDDAVQTFVELEGGGKPAFTALVADRWFSPYHWRVRHFKEREKHESTFTFAADGMPNGFVEHLAEDAPGAALSSDAARAIAEAAATRTWSVDLSPFRAVEQSEERRPGGRLDHTFVYERQDSSLGQGRYRLRLVVSGDALTELTCFIKIPDAFTRRYDEMRSLNTAIGVGASLAFLVVYGVGGIAFGLFVLARQRWVIWRQPIVWGVAVALAQAAAMINEWPLAWMQYDTALSTNSFIAQRIGLVLLELAVGAVLFSLSFMAAESLSRRAFPDHPQFWRIWNRHNGASTPVLGRTVAGYLLVPAFIAYDVALYYFATRWLGWWTPSEALFNPDVLAAYVPWFSAIAKSFQAGFWEEALFRAVPIAGAALIGDRIGKRRLCIVIAFVVQAVIFGAGHAPYPTQPAYARPVELVLPSIGFGLLYLVFGLLPGIILHFAFDAFWFSMPLFASSAAGIRVQQILIVVMIFVPLWVVLARRRRSRGAVPGITDVERNESWRPEAVAPAERAAEPVVLGDIPTARVRWIFAGAAIAAVVWVVVVLRAPVQHQSLEATRVDASRAARDALAPANLGAAWRFHPAVPMADATGSSSHRFVWETGGRTLYDSLLGSYLERPGWEVLVRTFAGDVAERAESWTVHLDANGAVERVGHELPESRPGPSLDAAAARQAARRALKEKFSIDEASLEEVSATPSKLPARTDWVITFKDRARILPRGEARLAVRLAGDEVAGVRRFVFIPEEWERTERNARTISTIVQGGGFLIAGALLFGGAIAAIVSWSRRRFAVGVFLAAFAAVLVCTALRFVNAFPATLPALSTSQPLQLQLAVLLGSSAVGITLQAAAMALIAGAVPVWLPARGNNTSMSLRIGLAVGMIASAARAVSALTGGAPLWPSYAGANSFVPFASAAITPLVALLSRLAITAVIVVAANRVSAGWTRRRALIGVLLVIVGGVLGTTASPLNVPLWIASAVVVGGLLAIFYVTVLRYDVGCIPIAVAVITTVGTLREAWLRAYPGALGGGILACVLIWLVAYQCFRVFRLPAQAVETIHSQKSTKAST
jgi:hypothetical protein